MGELACRACVARRFEARAELASGARRAPTAASVALVVASRALHASCLCVIASKRANAAFCATRTSGLVIFATRAVVAGQTGAAGKFTARTSCARRVVSGDFAGSALNAGGLADRADFANGASQARGQVSSSAVLSRLALRARSAGGGGAVLASGTGHARATGAGVLSSLASNTFAGLFHGVEAAGAVGGRTGTGGRERAAQTDSANRRSSNRAVFAQGTGGARTTSSRELARGAAHATACSRTAAPASSACFARAARDHVLELTGVARRTMPGTRLSTEPTTIAR